MKNDLYEAIFLFSNIPVILKTTKNKRKNYMSNFAIYLIGIVFVTGGLAWAANELGASPIWIGIGVIIIIGLGIMAAVSKTRQKEKSDTDK
ncbi:MAG: hypothetical protein Q8N83_04405 [Ignavibacteria bacterium]|nr:hypothetical protein [Ignavibacteria bacterium]